MPFLFQIGHSTAKDIHDELGHIACTFAGINYESRGSKGVLMGMAARGATNPLFRNHFHLVMPDDQVRAGLRYGNACAGHPYVLGQIPTRHQGGDCSGFMSGIIRAARGHALKRLFTTATFLDHAADLGFKPGLGGGVINSPLISSFAKENRPWPGHLITIGEPKSSNVKWIQARLNFASRTGTVELPHLLDENGRYDAVTADAVKRFQSQNVRTASGMVGRRSWRRLNTLR
jgi:peptidoglycan hydrolase-like protein with peptidoglycan-binding domain